MTGDASQPDVGEEVLVAEALRGVEQLSIVVFDHDMRIRAVHGGAVARHGYVPERLVGRRAPDVLPSAAWERVGPLYMRALTGETIVVEMRSEDGTAVYETTFQPVRRRGGVIGGMATSRDVTERVTAQEALRRSEHEFRLLAETTGDVVSRSAPDGSLLYVSPAARRVFGVEPGSLLRETVWRSIPPEDRRRVAAVRRAVLAGGRPRTVEHRVRRADGRVIWVETELRTVRDEETGAAVEVHCATRDVTQRRADEDVRRQWQLSFEKDKRGIVLVDPRSLVIAQVNPAFAVMHGGTRDDFVGRTLYSVFAPGSAHIVGEAGAVLEQEGYVELEADHVRLDGTVFPVAVDVAAARDADDRLIYRVGYVRDLTDERAREASERQAVARFESSFTQAPIGMAIVEPTGRLLRVNQSLCDLLDRSEDELLATDFQHLTHPEDLEKDLTLLRATLDGKRDGYEIDKRYLRPDGSVIEARLSVTLVRDEDGEPFHFVSQVVDLTALEETRRELAEAQGRLRSVLDHSPLAIYTRDLDGCWQVVNAETTKILGLPEEALVGRPIEETVAPEVAEEFAAHDREVLAADTAMSFDEVAPDARTGEFHQYWTLKFPVRDAAGALLGIGGMSLDVTARERISRELTAVRDLFETGFDTAPVGMVISRLEQDGSTTVLQCNAAFAAMSGRAPEDVVGRSGSLCVHPDDLGECRRLMAEAASGRPISGELRLVQPDGREVWALVTPAAVEDAEGQRLLVVQALDISERKRLEGRLQHLADHDALTGLFSRRRFEEELRREAARVRRHGGEACLLLLDLDGFKDVNDSFGHSAGDELLARLGDALRRVLRDVDVLARLGGDEFAVVLPGTDAAGGRVAAAKLVEAVRTNGRVIRSGGYAEVTASVGVTTMSAGGALDPELLLVEADIAMYQAKDAGKDRVSVYEQAERLRDEVVRRTDWIGRLRRAVRDESFVLHAQPVLPLLRPTGAREHFELLLRLSEPGDRLVTPDAFLPHAEESGIIVDIDRWVLGRAVDLLHAARAQGRDVQLAVNLSARSVQESDTVRHLERLLAQRPVPAGALMIEVTETAAITNVARAAELARQLRELGCLLALDDFGAGFASFSYLKHLAFDALKIDGDFIDRLPTSSTDQLVVRAVVDIARGLGAEVIAERVADQATVDMLTDLGVDYGQGFFLGRPRPFPG